MLLDTAAMASAKRDAKWPFSNADEESSK